ncbi:MAG: helix-turn-helix domain-containing protein [Chitinophagaceae bacterium]
MEKAFRKPGEDIYPQKIFANQLITVDDLLQFKKQLLDELLTTFKSQISIVPKKWMKSHEVRRLLKISPGTLQTLKSSGTIPYSKIGGIHFYDYEDIQQILHSGKVNCAGSKTG